MYRIFKNDINLQITQINEKTVADESKKIFSQFKNLSTSEIIKKIDVKIITTYFDGTYVFIKLKD